MPTAETQCELLVIGTGMAGMAGALFAANHQLDTIQVGLSSELHFASGLLDLLGVHPVETGQTWDNPWAGIRQLVKDVPEHPYGRLKAELIRRALDAFTQFMSHAGHPYVIHPGRNVLVPTPVGTLKTTYAVPRSMINGVRARASGTPCLLVGFAGLKGFSSRQIRETLGDEWPGLRAKTIAFPGMAGELLSEQLARALETVETRKKLGAVIRKHLGEEQAVGLPAVLGVRGNAQVLAGLESDLGIPVFEIPAIVPGVTGLRIREAFEEHLPRLGVRIHYQHKVLGVKTTRDGAFRLQIGTDRPTLNVLARSVLLASGRFLGKGLRAGRQGISESIFNLPVHQPVGRAAWHRKELFHKAGHPINQSGVMVDEYFRPVDENRRVVHPNLYSAGSVLAHQDWIRQKCGSGVAIATAYGAIDAYQRLSR